MKKLLLINFFFCICFYASAQPWMDDKYLGIKSSEDEWKRNNFFKIQEAFEIYENEYLTEHPEVVNLRTAEAFEESENAVPGRLQYKRWEWEAVHNMKSDGTLIDQDELLTNYKTYKQQYDQNSFNSALNWSINGPYHSGNGGLVPYLCRVNVVRVHPTDSSTIYAGTASGGVWKTTNGGQTWTPLTDYLPRLNCADIAIDRTNPNIIYLGTGDPDGGKATCGVYKTTDGGATWNLLNVPIVNNGLVYKVLIDPVNHNKVMVFATIGVFTSYNAGSTWSYRMVINGYRDVVFKPTNSSILYSAQYGNFYRSLDSGVTFTPITSGLPTSGVIRIAIGVTPADTSIVYLFMANNGGFTGFYKSTDGGTTFTLQANSPNLVGAYGGYNLAIAVNPANPNQILCGGQDTYYSSDGGVTWNYIVSFNIHVDVHNFEFGLTSNVVYECSDGGLSKSFDGGATWSDITDGILATEAYTIACSQNSPDYMTFGTQDNGTMFIYPSTNRTVGGGDGGTTVADFTDDNIFYLSQVNGKFYKTVNATNGFSSTAIVYSSGTNINSSGAWLVPFAINPADHNSLILGKNFLYTSADGGTSWNQVSGTSSYSTSSIQQFTKIVYCQSNPNYIYASGYRRFYVSTDGLTFTDLHAIMPDSNAYVNDLVVSSTDPLKVWICYSSTTGYSVFHSTDGGHTWMNFSTGLPMIPARAIFYKANSNDELFVGMEPGIYYRNASMNSWVDVTGNLPNVKISQFASHQSSGTLRVATYGRGVWQANMLNVSIQEPSTETKTFSVFPNPSMGYINMNLRGTWKEAKVVIRNMIGQELYSHSINDLLKLDSFNFKSGTYSVTISDEYSLVTKMLVIQ